MQLYAQSIADDILRDRINVLAVKHDLDCNQENRLELWACQDRKALVDTAKEMLWMGARLVADRNDDGRLSKSEFRAAEAFIDAEYRNLLGGCIGAPAQAGAPSERGKKGVASPQIECIADWNADKVGKPVQERRNRSLLEKVGHFIWDLITNW